MSFKIIDVTSDNFEKYGFYCVKNQKSSGYAAKKEWFTQSCNSSVTIKMAVDEKDKNLGFLEFSDSEHAWRPVSAENYLFINCIMVHGKKDRNKNVASKLINSVVDDAISKGKSGVCVMTSKGSWIADSSVFEKNSFKIVEKIGRFELLVRVLDENSALPVFINWEKNLAKYQGWNLIYADQCPWHEKSVTDMKQVAKEQNIELNIIKLETPKEAQNAPSGFGTFSIVYNGKLIEDHYISKTRFKNILLKE
ncbi:MAG: YoaP domain-containing protein [Bacteroidales bacterium]|nr:YoaP domain-containing protein [Bacteroidales bacterium]